MEQIRCGYWNGLPEIKHSIFFTQGKNLFTFLNKPLKILKYGENANKWSQFNVDLKNCGLPKDFIAEFVCGAPEFVLIMNASQIFQDAKYFVININNVMKLKDICFAKLCNIYYDRIKMLPEDKHSSWYYF